MTVESDNDTATLLADFGVPVTGAATFTAIYDHEYIEMGDITGNRPILTAPNAYPVTALTVGDALTVESTNYTVVRVESDGTGWCVVVLELV